MLIDREEFEKKLIGAFSSTVNGTQIVATIRHVLTQSEMTCSGCYPDKDKFCCKHCIRNMENREDAYNDDPAECATNDRERYTGNKNRVTPV